MSLLENVFAGGETVTLDSVLENREWRSNLQKQLEEKHPHDTILAIKLNIPGAIKNSPALKQLFTAGWRIFMARLSFWPVRYVKVLKDRVTGPEGFLVVAGPITEVKKEAIRFEQHFFLGRLFDIDVMAKNQDDYQLSRQALGFSPRTCLVCDENAKLCAQTQKHDLEELQTAVNDFYQEYFVKDPVIPAWDKKAVVNAALFAFLAEASTTPKPGLVDPASVGSHNDMDIFSFIDSSISLEGYFGSCFDAGREFHGSDLKALLLKIRPSGIRAEEAMFIATDGVNTHKGAIFTVGIFLAAYGYASRNYQDPSLSFVLDVVAQMGADLVAKELAQESVHDMTAGKKQYEEYRFTGVRGEVAGGLVPLEKVGLPELRRSSGDTNARLLNALMHLAANINDSTLIKRSKNPEIQKKMAEYSQKFFELGGADSDAGMAYLKELDEAFIKENLSIGGAADYLILTALVGRLTGLI
ncbi:citrate lyase holo-[acyl-carrier protein] synthase [Fructobacillus sp. M2-14]|uniref:Probable 2-(5''-triphosphoribosyl)-3'-dephosphocoenzyme-A synthase n=1 Tax=Fructobacillus broussonetiae TaxID=2713173 RepID=A0ABS5R0R5_9LACO|nr:citrate lyase holo-[acyl-carrier protein] synthase [Fructobacillus broussonetiae]MBS9338495.1 citrate lyase holo-[acyl-carrier protein] synthase [Fructobacillus broussonetiae]